MSNILFSELGDLWVYYNYAIIVDVDGTLCDVSSITHLVTGPKKDFDQFHTLSAGCPPIESTVDHLQQIHTSDDVAIIALTGRQKKFYDLTKSWMDEHSIPCDLLLMRPDGDFRADAIVKKELLDEIRNTGFFVIGAIDDNPTILQLWKGELIPLVIEVPGWNARNQVAE